MFVEISIGTLIVLIAVMVIAGFLVGMSLRDPYTW